MMRSAWRQRVLWVILLPALSSAACAPAKARPVARSPVAAPVDAPAEQAEQAEAAQPTGVPSAEALEAAQAFIFGGGTISREERHQARIAAARAQLVALNHAKRMREEREDLETQLQRELDAARPAKSHAR